METLICIATEHFTSQISPVECFELIINALALVWTRVALYYTIYLLFESEGVGVDYLFIIIYLLVKLH